MSQWITTHMGRDHFVSGHEQAGNLVDVYEIAHALAQINRFTGHASRPYSVAEHSLLCAELAAHDNKSHLVQLLCLCHDFHEAYTGDVASPMKNAVGLSWARVEHAQADQVRRQLGLATGFAAYRDVVKHYDSVALATERAALLPWHHQHNLPWYLDEPEQPVLAASWIRLQSIQRVRTTWSDWKNLLLQRFFDLQRACADDVARLDASATAAPEPATQHTA